MTILRSSILTLFLIFLMGGISAAQGSKNFEEIGFFYHEGGKAAATINRKAAFFKTEGKKAIVLAHQWGATKERWYDFSNILQKRGMASIALQHVGEDDVLGAINYLKAKGYTDISLMGASLGGGAIMRAMDTHPNSTISKIVLLGPGPGPAVQSINIDKLIIVSQKDFYAKRAYDAYREATEPKTLKEYPGYEHAQSLFDGEHKQDLITTLLKFLDLEDN